MNHQRVIYILLGCLFHFSIVAQTVGSRSVIKMTPAEFQILMETIMEAKQKKARRSRRRFLPSNNGGGGANGVAEVLKEQNLKQRLGDIEKLLIQIKEKQQAPPTISSPNNANSMPNSSELNELKAALFAELNAIKKEIEALPDAISSPSPSQAPTTNPVVIIPPASTSDSTATTITDTEQQMLFQLLVSHLDAMNQRLSDLQKQSSTTAQQDDLLLVQKKLETLTLGVAQSPDLNQNEKNILEKKLDALQELIERNSPVNSTKEKTTVIKETLPTDEEFIALKKLIAGHEKTVLFFDNNASQLNLKAVNQLNKVVQLLQEHKRLDVIATGFASEKGSPIYNEAISQNRTEAVKKHLMKQGLHATRIFTEYHGIDYNVKTPDKARRVEVVLLIRD